MCECERKQTSSQLSIAISNIYGIQDIKRQVLICNLKQLRFKSFFQQNVALYQDNETQAVFTVTCDEETDGQCVLVRDMNTLPSRINMYT